MLCPEEGIVPWNDGNTTQIILVFTFYLLKTLSMISHETHFPWDLNPNGGNSAFNYAGSDIFEHQVPLDVQIPNDVKSFIQRHVDLSMPFGTMVLKKGDDVYKKKIRQAQAELILHEHGTDGTTFMLEDGMDNIINLERLNDQRYCNKFLEASNENLNRNGLLIACVETNTARREKIYTRFPKYLSALVYFFDFLIKRVWPKIPKLRVIYYNILGYKDRVYSEIEAMGRLYSCGFQLVATKEINGLLYFVARKKGRPDYNLHPTYSPLIRLNRIGKNGKRIKVYKLRTMHAYSEYLQEYVYMKLGLQSGGKMKDDPRITTIGKYLRKYFLDELPMLINLLKGDIKLFGVRPLSPHYLSLYPKEARDERYGVKPGLIPPFYVDLPKTLEEIVDSEMRYISAYKKRPFITDCVYLFKAFKNIVFKSARSN